MHCLSCVTRNLSKPTVVDHSWSYARERQQSLVYITRWGVNGSRAERSYERASCGLCVWLQLWIRGPEHWSEFAFLLPIESVGVGFFATMSGSVEGVGKSQCCHYGWKASGERNECPFMGFEPFRKLCCANEFLCNRLGYGFARWRPYRTCFRDSGSPIGQHYLWEDTMDILYVADLSVVTLCAAKQISARECWDWNGKSDEWCERGRERA